MLVCCFSANSKVPNYKNCEPNLCALLLTKLESGVPHFIDQTYTGKELVIANYDISTIEQVGNLFKVWSYNSGFFHIKYRCFEGTPCVFVWDGRRTIH
jgi:hypothetical protein